MSMGLCYATVIIASQVFVEWLYTVTSALKTGCSSSIFSTKLSQLLFTKVMPLMLTLCISVFGSKYILPQGAQSLKKEVITR